ncbi:ankyrin repeat-containing domain protein [Chaetomium sp. MPI-SDFR-AT-0129]|nr:ankyrin repeat-containing domain protein [Chaetomium sp. MPI-SDFR-AT-0129]
MGNKELIECFKLADIKRRDRGGKTALHLVAIGTEGPQANRKDIARYLIDELKANQHEKDAQGWTPLHFAAKAGNMMLAVVKYLIEEAGADIHGLKGEIQEAYLNAAKKGHRGIVGYLVEKVGVDLEEKSHIAQEYTVGWVALCYAATKGHESVVKYLMEQAGASDSEKGDVGSTAACHAASEGRIDVVKYLIEQAGVSGNGRGEKRGTLVSWAAMHGREDVVRYLVEQAEADVNIQDKEGETALHWIVKRTYREVYEDRRHSRVADMARCPISH